MNPSRPPSDDELDRLLASRFRDTTPEFERRWRDLRRELRRTPVPRRWFPWPAWPAGLAAAVATLTWLLLALHPWTSSAPPAVATFSPAFAELADMDDILRPAAPLLEPENRAALLHLPAQPPPHT